MAWKKGPLPKDTFNYGGVQLQGSKGPGFFFADFCGDHVKLVDGRRVEAWEVRAFNNDIESVPKDLED